MKTVEVKLLLLCVLLSFVGTARIAEGDWDPGDGHKMHYPQLPDPFGWDVAFYSDIGQLELADDWMCSETGPVSDIHFWVSWQGDNVGVIDWIAVAIYSDNPMGPLGYSEPNQMLWQWNFSPGDWTERYYASGTQGWFDPFSPFWNVDDHAEYWQINITDINAPFIQEEGETYWLRIVMSATGGAVGWKTTPDHWNDDAVYRDSIAMFWKELLDPLMPQSLDLAFVITGTRPPVVKWVQHPDLADTGLDVDATVDGMWPPQILADDFNCVVTGPITDIHIWGSWYGDYLPNDDANMVEFTLSIHKDIPDSDPTDPDNWSMPGDVLWLRTFQPGDFDVSLYASNLQEGYFVPCVPYHEPGGDTVCWQYDFYIDPCDAFWQQGDPCNPMVHWLDVQAAPEDDMARFGWKTSLDHWNDDAVWMQGLDPWLGPWFELIYPSDHELAGQSIDLAFMITTEEQPHEELDYGDAPEGGMAYPTLGVMGAFPTCQTIGPPGHIQHGLDWAHFVNPAGGVPAWDAEPDGDAGLCPPPTAFPTYDDDECFLDGDAGLMFPESYTINPAGTAVVTCPTAMGSSLGTVCTTATWGVDVDIRVVNTMPVDGYVNVLMDWKQDGLWAGVASCGAAGGAAEHVLVDFGVPSGYAGPLSLVVPPPSPFLIGPNSGHVWSRFTITNVPIMNPDWDGEGSFEDGETEDYLLLVDAADLDFGDAPDPNYPTLLANDGARHVIGGPYFCDALGGDSPDSETDGQPHPWAIGDDIDADGDDEDGVTFPVLTIGVPTTISLNVCGAPAVGAWVQIWIDFNHDEDWDDAGEQIHNASLADGAYLIPVTAPVGSATGITFARCRISTAGGLLPTGQADDGEVEDHRVQIDPPPPPKPPTPHLKWSQPPIEIDPNIWPPIYCGWDEPSWVIEEDPLWFARAADDFRCLGTMPVTSIHWWGSYVGWQDVDPPPDAPITGWLIRFYSNVPAIAGADPNYSHPDELLWEIKIDDAARVPWEWVGLDEFPDRLPDTCFQYNVDLDPNEWFWQNHYVTRDDVYWISIQAVYPAGADPIYPWGWKTRPWHWMDDAVKYDCRSVDGAVVCRMWPIKDTVWGESYDLAFELDTDPNYIKWEQAYDSIHHWPHYSDEYSMANVYRYTEIKWSQYPDLEPGVSIDVDATADLFGFWPPQIIADDFNCTSPDPITDIHLWTSWFDDALPQGDPNNVIFTLSIHEDIPKGAADYSMPGDVLWWRQFYPGDFQSSIWEAFLDEGWYSPCTDFYEQGVDTVCWKYDFYIDPGEAFQQKGTLADPVVYWLDVQAEPWAADPWVRFGWKTSMEHWNDDGVWGVGQEPYVGPWNELRYPQFHPYDGNSIDLAFEITGESEDMVIHRMVADDWPCEANTPITAAAWWGSYIGYRYEACTDPRPRPTKPDYFLLTIWTDVPAGSDLTYSHPGQRIWTYNAYGYDEVLVGYDKHPEHSGLAGASAQAGSSDKPSLTPYLSEATIADTAGRVGANNAAGCVIPCPPGATIENEPNCGIPDTYNSGCNIIPPVFSPISCGETYCSTASWDGGAFDSDWYEITVTEDTVFTWTVEADFDVVIGLIETIPVGSGDCADMTGGFALVDIAAPCVQTSITTDCLPPGTYWFYVRPDLSGPTVDCNDYVATLTCEPCGKEPVFRYSVRIPEDKWFCQDEPNNVYWFSTVAVYDQNVPDYNWGWTNHEQVYNDDAVAGYVDPASGTWLWQELFDQTGTSEDMSFILFTEPECFPDTDPQYPQWVLQGKPRAWCCKYQSLGDVTGDGASNIFDLFIFRNSYGKAWPNPGYDCRADLNHDGAVNIFDLFIFRANYGTLFEANYSCPWKDDCCPHPCP